jgi:sialic acid synthase SpsE
LRLDALDLRLLVLEIGGNHGGDGELLASMVREAARIGAKAVKFQAYRAKSFVHPQNPYYEELLAEETPYPLLEDTADLAKDLGLGFGITVFDAEGIELALKKKADFIKISSGDITYLPLIRLAAQSGLPLVISTGASHEFEVKRAFRIASLEESKLIFLLQCASLYPALPEALNLAVMDRWLKEGIRAGLSDHTLGVKAPLVAFDSGALMVEKHFTTDRSLPGGDNLMSVNPKDARKILTRMEKGGKNDLLPIESSPSQSPIWGSDEKKPHPLERPDLIRRGASAAKRLPKGRILRPEDLSFLRMGETEDPLLGPETTLGEISLAKDLEPGEPVFLKDLKVPEERPTGP